MRTETEQEPPQETPDFSLQGGPLHRMGIRLGLVQDNVNTVRLGLAIGLVLWLIPAVLALAQGEQLFVFATLGAHVRLLVAVPLLFFAESMVDPRMSEFFRVVVRSRIVPGDSAALLHSQLARVARWKDMWLPEAVCLLVAIALYWLAPLMHLHGMDTTLDAGIGRAAGDWYSAVSLTALRFLQLRWIWRLLLWLYCVWALSRLPLRLLPTHPDGMAGLGQVDLILMHFTPLVLAISAVLSASFAVDIASGVMTFESIYAAAAVILLLDALIFVGPMFLFTPKLWACKVKGVSDYMMLAETYTAAFEQKWVHGKHSTEDLLGNSDIQSLADLGTSMDMLRSMHIVPVSSRTLLNMAVVALLPLAPLVLFKIPVAQLAAQLITRLTGA
ncbi:MAG: hypothetical protein KA187_00105 [Arenimonas sp.]|nr:hypothetical protein [Arenimonas sp.]MBP6625796.1 hypothetical protein [Arenimonas sp.]